MNGPRMVNGDLNNLLLTTKDTGQYHCCVQGFKLETGFRRVLKQGFESGIVHRSAPLSRAQCTASSIIEFTRTLRRRLTR